MDMRFWDIFDTKDLDYRNLPPLIPKGEDRETRINEIVKQWSTPWTSSAKPPPNSPLDFWRWVDQHRDADAFVLEKFDFRDDNTGEPVDLGEILRQVEEAIQNLSNPRAEQGDRVERQVEKAIQNLSNSRAEQGDRVERRIEKAIQNMKDPARLASSTSNALIAIRDCRIECCNALSVAILPSFVTVGVRFGDNASFAKAQFGDNAIFENARFGSNANFENARFGSNANFENARFGSNANFENARFGDNANFERARFGDNANFRYSQFGRGMKLHEADLSGADFRDVAGLVLDSTRIRGAQFSARAKDPWSVLRRTYTGPRMIFTLLFLALFFTPYAVRSAGWVGVHHGQERLAAAIEQLREQHEGGTQPLRGDLREDLNAIEALLPGAGSERWQETRVWRLVLGLDQGWLYFTLALVLIAYNFLRATLTLFVPPMRDAEERSGFSPRYRAAPLTYFKDMKVAPLLQGVDESCANRLWRALWRWSQARVLSTYWRWVWSHTEVYGWLMPIHCIVQALFWVAVIAFIWNAFLWLSYAVYIPILAN